MHPGNSGGAGAEQGRRVAGNRHHVPDEDTLHLDTGTQRISIFDLHVGHPTQGEGDGGHRSQDRGRAVTGQQDAEADQGTGSEWAETLMI